MVWRVRVGFRNWGREEFMYYYQCTGKLAQIHRMKDTTKLATVGKGNP